jgi:phage-related holin
VACILTQALKGNRMSKKSKKSFLAVALFIVVLFIVALADYFITNLNTDGIFDYNATYQENSDANISAGKEEK